MARMIPPRIRPDCSSPGEREIFRRLKNDPETDDWILLHSLDVAEHVTNIAGEIDFVAIIPGKGVLCVEVKACSSLRRRDGLWYYGTDTRPDARGPFKQASAAMHSIRTKLTTQRPDLSKIPFWSAVIFPYLQFSIESAEWHQWQVIDNRAFRSGSIGKLLNNVLDEVRRFLQTRESAPWFDPESTEPDHQQSEAIADVLRPDFEFFESADSRSGKLQKELTAYTVEQFGALDAMEANPRVAYVGPAGTGKTLLAIEATRRGASAGRKVLLLCFNRLLGKWLRGQLSVQGTGIVVKTIHQHMLAVSNADVVEDPDQTFWESELPLRAIETLLEAEDESNQFDELVVDEAQDILRGDYLDFLDLSLKGGLASGKWRFFGDFEKQAIYSAANITLEEVMTFRCDGVPVYDLRVNCRNTPRVAELAHLLGGLTPPYRRILRPDDGLEPRILYYSNDLEQKSLLVNSIELIRNEGFANQDIVILSPRADAACTASRVHGHPLSRRFLPIEESRKGFIGYCSVHAFKGMESPAVIVTDIERLDASSSSALFYVAVTRALQRLIILVHEPAKADILRTLLNTGIG